MTNDALTDKTIKELLHLGQQIGTPQQVGDVQYAIVPNDCQIKSLADMQYSQYRAQPHRKIALVQVLDSTSFVEYYTLFSDVHSRVFADEPNSSVTAYLDYHGAGENAPRWCQHRLNLKLEHSEEWGAWMGLSSEKMGQMEFAEFIEDNTPDIIAPRAADMLEMARTLQARSEVDFSSAIRLNNGAVQLTYNEQVKGTYGSGKVEIPEQFTIAIPVYIGTARVSITARLRYRINSGKLAIWYDLLRAEAVRREAFLSVLSDIQSGLTIFIIKGSLKL